MSCHLLQSVYLYFLRNDSSFAFLFTDIGENWMKNVGFKHRICQKNSTCHVQEPFPFEKSSHLLFFWLCWSCLHSRSLSLSIGLLIFSSKYLIHWTSCFFFACRKVFLSLTSAGEVFYFFHEYVDLCSASCLVFFTIHLFCLQCKPVHRSSAIHKHILTLLKGELALGA